MIALPALIDTNILCYALDAGELERRTIAAGLLSQCWRSEIALFGFGAKPRGIFSYCDRES